MASSCLLATVAQSSALGCNQAIRQFRKMDAANAAKTMLLLGIVMVAAGTLLLIAVGLEVQ